LVHLVGEYTSVELVLSEVMGKMRLKRRAEWVPVWKGYGRVSATDLLAQADVPPFPASHMDGFAVISKDLRKTTESGLALLKVVGEVGPGARPKHRLKSGEAVQVATGAYLPEGSDAVVPIENAEVKGSDVLVKIAPEPGSHVFEKGGDVGRGQVLLPRGRPVRAQDVGMMIALGLTKVSVFTRPRVSVIATGNELTPATRPNAGKIVESHAPILVSLLQALGCVPLDLGIVKDDAAALKRTLRKAVSTSDFVLTLGGTSAGKRDYVVEAVSSLEPSVLHHGIKLDRGRVTAIACVRGKPVLMLPGPIQAAMNAFFVLASPIISRLSGSNTVGFELPCKLGEDWESRKRFADFEKVIYVKLQAGTEAVAVPLSGETESLRLLAEASGYVVVPEGVARLAAGSPVRVKLFPGFSYVL